MKSKNNTNKFLRNLNIATILLSAVFVLFNILLMTKPVSRKAFLEKTFQFSGTIESFDKNVLAIKSGDEILRFLISEKTKGIVQTYEESNLQNPEKEDIIDPAQLPMFLNTAQKVKGSAVQLMFQMPKIQEIYIVSTYRMQSLSELEERNKLFPPRNLPKQIEF